MQRKVDFTDHSCLICGRYCKNRRSLGNHLHKTHETSIEIYVLERYCGGTIPLCLCGCGQAVNWHKTQYHYCDYISGHNDAGFSSVNQPNWTQEKLSRRNDAIKKAYEQRGDVISRKISTSLRQTFSQETAKQNLSIAQKRIWADPSYKDKMKAIRKRVWSEQYDELCAKIFTPEFGRKISAANARRDMKHTSKEEESFKDHLQNIFGDDLRRDGLWINDPIDGSAHYDAILSSKRMLIEWDGTYYHGLDRDECFDLTQVIHMANDLRKNRIATQHSYELVRIPGDTDVGCIQGIDDLIKVSRHHQLVDGTIVKDGMFRFRDDHHVLISREQLIRWNEDSVFPDAPGRSFTEQEVKPAVVAFLREYAFARGWFYPVQDETLDDAIQSIRKSWRPIVDGTVSSLGSVGSPFLKSVFRSYWDVIGGPRESFWDDKTLDRIVSYRLGLNDSKNYAYVLNDGQTVQCKETFDINIKNIRYGFIVQRAAVSWFKPGAAYSIYRHMLDGIAAPVVWDPSCGFGARLLGFMAAFPNGTYIGTDPATRTFNDLCSLRDCSTHLPTQIDLHCVGSESFDPGCELDLVFTSPPYFDREKYFDEDNQCWRAFPTADLWIDGFLKPTFRTSFSRLRPGAKMVINIDKKNEGVVIAAALDVGFTQLPGLQLAIGRDHFSKKKGRSIGKTESILIFRK